MKVFGFDISIRKGSQNRIPRRRGGGGRYNVVSTDEYLRDRGSIERGEEVDILDRQKRGRLLDMARNQARNSSTFNAILKQFDLNAVGCVGGKASFLLGDETVNEEVREAFAMWARSCEFFDGLRLNDLLKVVLKSYLIGGEVVLLFDDGMLEDSGKVVVFEPDEIADMSPRHFEERFPGYQQIDGHILNAHGRQCGVVVSHGHRGETEFPADACMALFRDPNGNDAEDVWINPRNVWRKNQIVGVSPIASSLASVIDLEDLSKYELQSAKKNSQTLAQVIQSEQEESAPSAFDAGTDFGSMSDEEIASAADEESAGVQTMSLDRVRGSGCTYEVMPEGTRLELLDTKHPNPNMPAFIDWQAGRSAAPLGLSRMFATMRVEQSFSACQGELNMSWPAFEEAQKFIEHICDWILARWVKWAVRRGDLPSSMLGVDIVRAVSWAWPRQRAVNAVDEQTAIEKRLRNMTGSYADIYGADWREKLAHIADEVRWCRDNGITHPSTVTVSGSTVGQEVPAQEGEQ